MTFKEILPILIPVVIVQLGLLGYTINHILKHDSYKRGNRKIWLAVSIIGMEFIGPLLYFMIGKKDD